MRARKYYPPEIWGPRNNAVQSACQPQKFRSTDVD